MAAGVSFSLDDASARQALARLERVSREPQGAYDALGAHFVFSSQRNIEREQAPDGTPWPRLSSRTAAHRIGKGRRGFEHMLRVTTRLYRSISYQTLPDGVEWGSNLEYARIHQLGGTVNMPARAAKVTLKSIRKKGGGFRSRFVRPGTRNSETRDVSIGAHQVRIPARPYLGVGPYDRERVPEIVADHLRSEVGS